MKIAIVHDYLNQYGGAERVLECLLEMFPEADVYTLFFDRQVGGGRFAGYKIKTSWLDWPIVWRRHRFFIPLMPLAAQSLNLGDKYDLIISATAGYAKGIRYDSQTTRHVCYCYTPLRYAWEDGYLGKWQIANSKWLLKPILNYLRAWDYKMVQRPDKIIAISNHIAGKIKKYYDREAVVIYPPLDTTKFYEVELRKNPYEVRLRKYFLAVGRLIHYKNFDLIVRAFNILQKPLKIVGVGPELARLKKIAGPNIEFLSFVPSDDELRKLYNGAQAFIFASAEDFGLVMAEAQACGTPVIALAAGGALEIVKEGETGIFFHEPTKESLVAAVYKFEKLKFDRKKIAQTAQKFSTKNFQMSLQKQMEM